MVRSYGRDRDRRSARNMKSESVDMERLQGDTSGCDEPPVDFKTKVPFWPGLARMELVF